MAKASKEDLKNKKLYEEVVGYKTMCEANIIGCLWKEPEMMDTYDLKIENFSDNTWKVYFAIGKSLYHNENKKVLDDLTVGIYLEKHEKLAEKYEEYGGYKTMQDLMDFVVLENLDGYVMELMKWDKVLELHKKKFPVEHMISKIKDIGIEDLYNTYEAVLNHIFMDNMSGTTKSYNLCEDIHTLIDECDEGMDVGFPINAPMLNEEINGSMLGNITLLGGISGTGKTTLSIEWLLPSIIQHNEKIVFVINEQDQKKMRKELLTWVANNIFNTPFNKKRLRQGSFTKEEMDLLRKCADWIEEKKENRNITVIPLQSYTVETMIKIMKKYSAMGVNYFVLDTFKESDDAKDESWKSMMTDMRKLYDIVKPASKNLHLWATVQLKKGAISSRYLTMDNIGMSKNIVDVCSTVILMRGLREDEKKEDGLKVYILKGKNGTTKVPVKLNPDKNYAMVFIEKNREGSARAYQIVAESNLGYNTYKEVGITVIEEDY